MKEALPFIFVCLGVFARVFVPWLIKRYKNPEPGQWQWRYLVTQLLGFVIVLLVAPIVLNGDLEAIQVLSPGIAYFTGWGVADQAVVLFLDDVPEATRRN